MKDRTPQKPRPQRRTIAKKQTRATKKELQDAGYTPNVQVIMPIADFDTQEVDETVVALSPDHLSFHPSPGEKFKIATSFKEGGFLSAGVLSFPKGSSKSSRSAGVYALVFYVINGSLQVTIDDHSFVIGTGGQFFIPRGCQYDIKNVNNGESKAHFCHCKDSRD